MRNRFSYYLLILLVEGAALMAVELMGAKLVTPFYGSSLYVWTGILGFTVSGLTLGYYFGGRLSAGVVTEQTLFAILGISALLVAAMPYTTSGLIILTANISLIPAICTTCILLLLPPVLCFGMVGPLVVKLLATRLQSSGSIAGNVYFISTCGGILATFLFGFYLIPVAGLRFCSCITGVSLALTSVICFAAYKRIPQQAIQVPETKPVADKKNKPRKENKDPLIAVPRSIYLYAVLEGATVTAVELLAAKMMAPYFGTSLYVWATVMAFTLAGLALGYFAGGRLPGRYQPTRAIWWSLLAASLFILLMHITAQQLTLALDTISIRAASIVVAGILIIPPLLFLGMVPTLLVRCISSGATDAGITTGRVFTLSSAAGIVSLFVFGFYVIPGYGLTNPAIFVGIILGAVPFIKLMQLKKHAAGLYIAAILCSLFAIKTTEPGQNITVRYYSEGLLGQVLVADIKNYGNGIAVDDRILLLNKIGEAQIDKTTGLTRWDYPNYVTSLCSSLPQGAHALMLGLGGGSIPNMLNKYLKINVDAVELDPRIASVAQNYFSLSKDVNVIVDDARHYIETSTKTYDVIIIDVFHGDIAPPHMLSVECFTKARAMLNKNGFIIVNFLGFVTGDIGKPGRSLYKTMTAAGLHTQLLPTLGKNEEDRNVLLIGSIGTPDFNNLRSPLLLGGKAVNIDTLYIDTKKLDLKNASVFTDNAPILDLINMDAAFNLRMAYYDFTKLSLKNGIPLFQ